jgi:hypothetical protein
VFTTTTAICTVSCFHEQPKTDSHLYSKLKPTRNAMRRKLLCIAVQPKLMWIQATGLTRVKAPAPGKQLLTLGVPNEVWIFALAVLAIM